MKPLPQFPLTSLRSAVVASAMLFGLGATPAFADGNNTIGAPSIAIASGSGVVTAGVGLDGGTGTIVINVPLGATIKQVLFYASYRHDQQGSPPGPTVSLNGVDVAVEAIGLSDPADGSPFATSARVDVTELGLVAPGSNEVEVATTIENGAFEGGSLVVIYNDATGTIYGGNAFSASAKVGINGGGNVTKVGDTGPLAASGGFQAPDDLVNVKIPKILSSRTLRSEVSGFDGVTTAFASTEGLKLNLGLLVPVAIGARAVEATAVAACTASGGAAVSGGSRFLQLGLSLFGESESLGIRFQPNTTLLNIPGLITIVANQQFKTGSGSSKAITVNALRVTVPLLATDVIVSSATASIGCAPPVPLDLSVVDGNDFAFGGSPLASPAIDKTTNKQTFTFASKGFDRVAQLHLLVGDADASRADVIEYSVNGGPVTRLVNTLNSSAGFEWDNDTLSIPVPAGASSLSVQLLSKRGTGVPTSTKFDSFHWVAGLLSLPTQAPVNLYSGRATILRADVAGLASVVALDTGSLPASGGNLKNEASNLLLPSLLSASTARVTSQGGGENSDSQAIVEDLVLTLSAGTDLPLGALADLLAAGLNVKAAVVDSQSHASCDANNVASVTGSSTIADLVIGSGLGTLLGASTLDELKLLLDASGKVSVQLTPLIKVDIYVDEQVVFQSGKLASIDVNALRINIPKASLLGNALNLSSDVVNIVVGHSHADIVCN